MFKAEVVKNQRISSSIYNLLLKVPQEALSAAFPGQFFMIKVSPYFDPFLPRPFTIHATFGDNLEILYQVVGRGTFAMTLLKPKDEVGIYGPLGKPFPALPTPYIAVAGGVGVAGFGFLCQGLRKNLPAPAKLIFGARTASELVKLDFFSSLTTLLSATDDGSFGFHGTATDLLAKELKEGRYEAILACGPRAMLRAVANLGKIMGIKTYVVLDTVLACGMGYCLGCAVPKRGGGYFKLCLDGPTFDAEEIDLEASG